MEHKILLLTLGKKKEKAKMMCELCGRWHVVGFLYAAEFSCLKTSIPVESVTSTMLTFSDIFTTESSLMSLYD